MAVANYLSMVSIPLVILIIVANGFIERKKIFDIFIDGAKEGIGIVVNIFPTLIGLFMAISALRVSGILDLIINAITPILNILKIPSEIMPLAILRPISGSASMAVGIDIMKNYGVDSKIRNDNFYNNGFNGNNFIHNCNIYKCCQHKKNEGSFKSCFNRRYNRNVNCCNILAVFVVKIFLTLF